MGRTIITRQCLLKILLFVIIVLTICSCNLDNYPHYIHEENKSDITPKAKTFRGQYYYKDGNDSVEYFDDITHDLRQLLYTCDCYNDSIIYDIKFVLVADYDKFVSTIKSMIDSHAYAIYVDFPVVTENTSSEEKAVQLANYYFDNCGISHDKEIVIKTRCNQDTFWFDKIDTTFFMAYFDNHNYDVLKVAKISDVETVSSFSDYMRVAL